MKIEMENMTDAELSELHKAASKLAPKNRDLVRDRVAFMRSIIEVTGCRTAAEAVEQIKIWKGKIDAASSNN